MKVRTTKKKVLFTATVVKTHINTFHLPFLKMFKEKGYEVHVAAKNDFINEECIIPNCDKHYDINFERNPFSKANIQAYKELKKIIKQNKYDIIHCHTPVASVLTRLAAKDERNTTVIYTAHGFHFFKGAPLINWLIYYPVEWFSAKLTDKLITINKEDYERAKKWILRRNGKVYYVPGVGIDFSKFNTKEIDKAEKRKELGISENTKIILSVGELNKNKNHESVIRALAEIKDQDFVYLIAGRGELQSYLSSLIHEQRLQEKVKLLGFRTDVNELLRIADLFVFPSKREGLPVSLIEAMACGVNCIASDVRGNNDLLTQDKLFKTCDVDSLKEMMETELKKIEKVEYKNLKQYSLENVLGRMAEIYDEK